MLPQKKKSVMKQTTWRAQLFVIIDITGIVKRWETNIDFTI